MGFKLRKIGKHLADNIGKMADDVCSKVECSIVAPPMPVMLGAAAFGFGLAAIKHFKKRKAKNQQTSSTPSSEVCVCR